MVGKEEGSALSLFFMLQLFLGAVFDTLLYQLNDGLSRLAIVRKYESEKDGGFYR